MSINDVKFEFEQLINCIEAISVVFVSQEKLHDNYDEQLFKKHEKCLNDYSEGEYDLKEEYNKFYTKSCRLLSVVLPERLEEFCSCYVHNNKANLRGPLRTISTFFAETGEYSTLKSDISSQEHTYNLFIRQKNILISAYDILDNALYNIKNIIQYDFYSSELKTAEYLLKKNYIRVAGVIAGVALERHLKNVCENKNISIKKKDTLSNYIEHLRTNNIIDSIADRKLLRLTDIRNLCCHKKDREPTIDEVQELITGVNQILIDIN